MEKHGHKEGKSVWQLGGEGKKKWEISGSYKAKENHKIGFMTFPHHQNRKTNKPTNPQHYLIYFANTSLIYQLSFDSLWCYLLCKSVLIFLVKFVNYCLQFSLNFESQLENLPLTFRSPIMLEFVSMFISVFTSLYDA